MAKKKISRVAVPFKFFRQSPKIRCMLTSGSRILNVYLSVMVITKKNLDVLGIFSGLKNTLCDCHAVKFDSGYHPFILYL